MYLIKLAVAMVLAGGVQRKDSSGIKIRGISFVCYVSTLTIRKEGNKTLLFLPFLNHLRRPGKHF